jgi:hypothetical protein
LDEIEVERRARQHPTLCAQLIPLPEPISICVADDEDSQGQAAD